MILLIKIGMKLALFVQRIQQELLFSISSFHEHKSSLFVVKSQHRNGIGLKKAAEKVFKILAQMDISVFFKVILFIKCPVLV
jgi:hypothetical protein